MPEPIGYVSTNRDLSLDQLLQIKGVSQNISAFRDEISFKEALEIGGQTPDTGLVVPTRIPHITNEEIVSLKDRPVSDAAYLLFRKFITPEEIPNTDLRELVDDAYNYGFPLEHLEKRQYMLMHTEGPTGDFKNTGARANARLLSMLSEPYKQYIRVTTTSGDTGGAVGVADSGVPRLHSLLLYPKGRVSNVQEQIMRTGGDNVYPIAVQKASFSDIQDGMGKIALGDIELREELAKINFGLMSGNSINWGRLMPQIAHYLYSYAQLANIGEPVVFVTPMGNGGHGLAGEYFRRMVDFDVFSVWPTNENDVLPRYMVSDVHRPLTDVEFVVCKSCSMDVKMPSNNMRLFYLFGGIVAKDGRVFVRPDKNEMRKHIFSTQVTRKMEEQTIIEFYQRHRIPIEPHTACMVNGMWQYLEREGPQNDTLIIGQSTAHKYKFHEYLNELLGVQIEKPDIYKRLDGLKETGMDMEFGYDNLKRFILEIASEHHKNG